MSELLTLAEQVRRDVTDLRDAKVTGDKIERLARSEESIDAVASDIQRHLDFIASAGGDDAWKQSPAVKAVTKAAQELVSCPPEGDEAIEVAEGLRTQLEQASEVLRDDARATWLQFARRISVGEQRALFEALAAIPALRERFQGSAQRAKTLETELAQPNPPGGAQFRMLKRSLADLEQDVEDAKIADLPDLPDFLKRCVTGGATLRDLRERPDMLEWIVAQDLEDHFFLRPGQPKARS